MELIDQLFEKLDSWRNLPNYQLERRADIFFALYLPRVLEAKLGFRIDPELVPEFPVRIGTIFPSIITNKSFKVDYLAFSADSKRAVFVELKTDRFSRRDKQDEYLLKAKEVGMTNLLDGLLKIFKATNSKRKYFYLIQYLERLRQLRLPPTMMELMTSANLHGINDEIDKVKVTSQVKDILVVYIQPDNVISFQEFASVVRESKDALSQRFATSLIEWSKVQAGKKPFSK